MMTMMTMMLNWGWLLWLPQAPQSSACYCPRQVTPTGKNRIDQIKSGVDDNDDDHGDEYEDDADHDYKDDNGEQEDACLRQQRYLRLWCWSYLRQVSQQ